MATEIEKVEILKALVAKQRKSTREHLEGVIYTLEEYEGQYYIVGRDNTFKTKFSFSVKDNNVVYIREDLYDLKNPMVQEEMFLAYTIYMREYKHHKDLGMSGKLVSGKVKRISNEESVQIMKDKYGETKYFEVFSDGRKKKAEKEVKSISSKLASLEAMKKATMADLTIPSAQPKSVDEELVQQIDKSLEINELFKQEVVDLASEFDNDEIKIPEVATRVEALPMNVGLSQEELTVEELPSIDIFEDDDFDLSNYLDDENFF